MSSNSDLLNYFKDNYLNKEKNLRIINVGDSEKDYSYLFDNSNWNFLVLDEVELGNADIQVNDINHWDELNDEYCDVVISKNFFSNLKYFWLVMFQIERVLKPGGMACIIVPDALSNREMSKPLNIFTSESLKSLAEYVNLNVIELIEKNSELCLIASKDNVAQNILLDSYEQDSFKTKRDVALERYQSKLNEIDKLNSNLDNVLDNIKSSLFILDDENLRNNLESNIREVKNSHLQLNSVFSEIKHIFLDFNNPNHVYCPICQKVHNIFSPFGNPSRLNSQCPNCYSLEEDRLIYLFLTEEKNVLSRKIKLLHFAPDKSLYNHFKHLNNVEYSSVGVTLSDTVDEFIDFKNGKFSKDSFDVAIVDYSFLNNYDGSFDVLSELYKYIKPQNEGGFLLINLSSLDDFNYEDVVALNNQLESVGFQVSKYESEDIVDSELMEIYGIIPSWIYVCEK